MNHYGDLEPRTEQTVHYATKDVYEVSLNQSGALPKILADTCKVCHEYGSC